ncbi:MAG: Asp-tRNA(Asn)/Glu-tRNA(Gln) amidotransferase subunit GatC [Bacilli bacterium]|nr:Asp-tRNA(Asn)/Glu-tRNA(Gln) amidotransferase subunit GatC [Bacilli bacterium]
MMELTKEEIQKVAENARLHLTDEEVEKYTKTTNEMINHVQKLLELNTDDVEPTTHGNTVKDVLRNDIPKRWEDRDQIFKNAPDHEDNQFKVPALID